MSASGIEQITTILITQFVFLIEEVILDKACFALFLFNRSYT